jgi:hypothetical protein
MIMMIAAHWILPHPSHSLVRQEVGALEGPLGVTVGPPWTSGLQLAIWARCMTGSSGRSAVLRPHGAAQRYSCVETLDAVCSNQPP